MVLEEGEEVRDVEGGWGERVRTVCLLSVGLFR